MGKLIIFQWYYISIWSNEPQYEDEHIHIYRNRSRQVLGAKFNIETLEFIEQGDFTSKEINRILNDIIENIDVIKSQLDAWKSKEKVKVIKMHKKGK